MPCVRIIVVTDDATLTPFFSADNKMPSLVSIHAELTGVTGVFEVRPVLEGSGRDADPCQRQLLGPFVLAKNDCSSAHRHKHRKRQAPQPTPNRRIEGSTAFSSILSNWGALPSIKCAN